ncbi:MAG: hypothetical protein K2O85_06855 [Helicobacter sp.]|nr:hypothetical protein [Helicobacter sp.]
MLKRISVATLCVAIGSSLAFAAPSAKNETHDLLAAASNNAVSQNNVGVQKLSKAEMEQVEGGKFSLRNLFLPKLSPRCGRLVCIKP